ncbi:hypothetical protein [Streptomyces sp. NPDC048473]|uniref:hypothetical protein n=1 Tax=Streptomyces sp. NPDC048473 TaxID=3365556 RepID=UPI00371621A2
MTRTLLPGRGDVFEQTEVLLLPPGYVAASTGTEQGSDELRIKRLMIAAIDRVGWARCAGGWL